MNKKFIVILAFILLFAIFVFQFSIAEIYKGIDQLNLSKHSYSPGELLQGKVNFSLFNEPTNTIVKTDLPNSQKTFLIDFLKSTLSAENDFICIPSHCNDYYDTKGSNVASKTILNGTSIIGPEIVGKNIEIKQTALRFDIISQDTASTFTESPIKIDLLNDGTVDWMYLEPSSTFGSEIKSLCYNSSNSTRSYDITSNGLCQRIKLPQSSKFRINAAVRKSAADSAGTLVAYIYDATNSIDSDTCNLMPQPISAVSYTTANCVVDFKAIDTNADYYACVKEMDSDGAYKIKGGIGDINESCPYGYVGYPQTGEVGSADFAITINAAKIAPFVNTVTFNASEFENTHSISLREYIQDYVNSKYNGDCIKNKCLIPINILTKIPLTINNLDIGFCSSSLCQSTSDIYEIIPAKAKIKMNYTAVDLEGANISAPDTFSTYNFHFYIGATSFGLANLTVEKVPVIQSITPKTISAPGIPATIVVFAYSPNNLSLTSFEWDFGDNETDTTETSSVVHSYGSAGTFKLSVRVFDSKGGNSKKTFNLIVGSAKDVINSSIYEKNKSLNNFIASIAANYSAWEEQAIKEVVDVEQLSSELGQLKAQFNSATTDDKYVSILSSLDSLAIPVSVYTFSTAPSFSYTTDPDLIDLGAASTAGAGEYDEDNADSLKMLIAAWQNENLDMQIGSKIIAISQKDGSKDYVTSITIDAFPKTEAVAAAYLILLSDYDSAKFDSNYGQEKADSGISIALEEGFSDKTIKFAVPESVTPENFVFFATPDFAELGEPSTVCNSDGICEVELGETVENCREDCKPVRTGILLFIGLLFFVFVLYFILKWWYETKYESYLFKNRQDFANITLFISNALNRNVPEKEMREKLKKAGWTGEQIEYAVNKVKGIRMGMPSLMHGIKRKQHERESARR